MKPFSRVIAPLLTVALLAACSQGATDADTAAAPAETAAPVAAEPSAVPEGTTPADAGSMDMSGADHQAMGMSGSGTEAAGTAATASGTVESVDPVAGKIVIAHGPVEALKWPAMKMGFTATPDQIDAVQAGQKVDFEFMSQGAKNTLTRIAPAQ